MAGLETSNGYVVVGADEHGGIMVSSKGDRYLYFTKEDIEAIVKLCKDDRGVHTVVYT